jgi:anti-sigma B factor antagonist
MDDVAPQPASDNGHPLATVEDWPEGSGHALKIAGELDISTVGSVRSAFDHVTATRPATLILDLSELRFIDSSGLALLLVAAREVGSVKLRNPSPPVRRVIEITGLGEILPLEP